MNRVSLRPATPEDWPAIRTLHREHQAAQGTNYELPDLFHPIICVALVGVDEQGVIRNCVYVETIAELRVIGRDARAIASGRRHIGGLSRALQQAGFRWLECFVPQPVKHLIQKPLEHAGFTCVDQELAHFTKDLRRQT